MDAETAKTITSGANSIVRTARLEWEILAKAKNMKAHDILGVTVPGDPKLIGDDEE